jgi:cleavage and polyadenylation specificity factor subunit 3
VSINKPFADIRLALEVMFEGIEGSGHLPVRSISTPPPPPSAAGAASGGHGDAKQQQQPAAAAAAERQREQEAAVSVGDVVVVRYRPANAALGYDAHVVLEWAGGSKGDVVADAVLAVLLQTAGEPSSAVRAEQQRQAALAAGDAAAALQAEVQLAAMLLEAQFGPVRVDEAAGTIGFCVDGVRVVVDHAAQKVACDSEPLRARLEKVMQRIGEALKPCAMDFED